jgi:hypothetical protein
MKRLLAVIVWLLLYCSTFGMEAWESNYTLLLQKYVKTSGVQYSVWKENSADVQALKEIINQIGASGPSSPERQAQLAYYKLNKMTRAFLNNTSEAIKPAEYGYAVSKIFDWYKDGFVASGGTVGFINKYRGEMIPPDAKISFQDYNWNLNEAK